MSRALVAIGVSTAPPLPRLDGAITDALAMADWATKSGYEHVHVFTDDNGTLVEAAPLYQCCKALIERPELEQLVIYFAGHGYAPFPGHETWLLSKWNTESNEAINATLSVQYAQCFARPRTSFIADACRTSRSTNAPVIGSIIIPRPGEAPVLPQVDQFYATPFGHPAQEVSDPHSSYGLFSREVQNALRGAALIVRGPDRVVTSRSLKDYLDEAVPTAFEALSGAEAQFPDTNARWRAPDDVYTNIALSPIRGKGSGPLPTLKDRFIAARAPVSAARQQRDKAISEAAQRYRSAEGRQSFETQMGVTVIGAQVDVVVMSEGEFQLFTEFGAQQIRVASIRPVTVLLRLVHPRWFGYHVPVAVYPGLIATLVIDDAGASSLNYRRSRNMQWGQTPDFEVREVESILSDVSSMLRHGAMPGEKRITQMVQFLRQRKDVNPALAVVAAHVCHRVGDFVTIKDMENYDIGMGHFSPFDLILLSGSFTPRSGRIQVGKFPFMSRGWGLLGAANFQIDARLFDASRGVGPSLWSMANPEAGEILAEIVQSEHPDPTYSVMA